MKSCFYCGESATTKDHIIPASLGGLRTKKNTVDACKLCNNTRCNIPQEDFIRFMNFIKEKGLKYSSLSGRVRRNLKAEFLKKTGIRVAPIQTDKVH